MKASRSRGQRSSTASQRETPAAPADVRIVQMKPQRTAMIVLLLVFIVWLGVLLALYFRTIYHREGEDDPARGAGWTAWVDGDAAAGRADASAPAVATAAGGLLMMDR